MTPTRERSFEDLARDLDHLEQVVAGWDEEAHRGTVRALRSTLEALHKGALTALIRRARSLDGGVEVLRAALEDPAVAAIFSYHELIRSPAPSLEERVEAALESVRPTLASHDGDVELVAVEPPEVKLRLKGNCHGCAHSEVTVRYGIEEAIKQAAEEITKVTVVAPEQAEKLVGLRGLSGSPFEGTWEDAGPADAIPEGDVLAVELERASVLLTVGEGEVRAFPNACTHLGMPLDGGEVKDGLLTCAYHGFSYVIATGECVTAPETQLPRLPCRVEAGRVLVQTRSPS